MKTRILIIGLGLLVFGIVNLFSYLPVHFVLFVRKFVLDVLWNAKNISMTKIV